MTLPRTDTVVSYPSGAVEGRGTIVHCETLDDGRLAVLLDSTPCHPVDAGWPDQGPDRAILAAQGTEWPVQDCVVAATDGETLFLGKDIPVRKGTDGWAFVVAHVIAPGSGEVPTEGADAVVVVDADYRRALSRGHTGCHLASLALNLAMADRWTKDTRADALGTPDFDAAAIASSSITENGSVDVFRLNKSLRRKGFNADGLTVALPAITDAINSTLESWLDSAADIRVDRDGDRLTDRRYWIAELPQGTASIPCGGTHVDSVRDLGALHVQFFVADDDGTTVLRMVTRAG